MSAALAGAHVLVTGAGGFIGSRLVRALHGRVRALSALLGPPDAQLSPAPAGVQGTCTQIEDLDALLQLTSGVDEVVHLAGPSSVAASFADPERTWRAHALGTAALVEACRRNGVQRLVHVSSAEVYGSGAAERVAEDAPLRPRSPYARAKCRAEESVAEWTAGSAEAAALVLRPFSVYGPGARRDSLVATLLRQAAEDDEIALHDLQPVRDYCFVDDVVEALVAALESPRRPGLRTFNVGSGQGISVLELARVGCEAAGRALPIRTSGRSDRPASARVDRLVADPRRARAELGWQARTPLREGLARTLFEVGETRRRFA